MLKQITKEENYHKFFLNLGNPLKIDIVAELEKGEKTVTELSKILKKERSTVSHALLELRKCSFVFVEKNGRKRVYHLNKDTVLPLLKMADAHVQKYCKYCERC